MLINIWFHGTTNPFERYLYILSEKYQSSWNMWMSRPYKRQFTGSACETETNGSMPDVQWIESGQGCGSCWRRGRRLNISLRCAWGRRSTISVDNMQNKKNYCLSLEPNKMSHWRLELTQFATIWRTIELRPAASCWTLNQNFVLLPYLD